MSIRRLLALAVLFAAPAYANTLTYHGGKLMTAPRFVNVFWGSYWTGAGAGAVPYLNAFVKDLAASPTYTSALEEYSVVKYPIAAGSSLGGYVVPGSPGDPVSDFSIRAFLDGAIKSGQVPARADDNVYVVLLQNGFTFDGLGTAGGYHTVNQVSTTGGLVHYIVIPYAGADENTTFTLSHEMAETITDPDALDLSRGWYDDSAGIQGPFTGEIGDLCESQSGVVDGYVVSTLWSNTQNACVIQGLQAVGGGCPAGEHDEGGICVPDSIPTGCSSASPGALAFAALALVIALRRASRVARA